MKPSYFLLGALRAIPRGITNQRCPLYMWAFLIGDGPREQANCLACVRIERAERCRAIQRDREPGPKAKS
jgi:hypothetical protein